jgi:16S rRNA (cytosine967-C5)-methyltransferase
MARYHSHVNTAKTILGAYQGAVPFSVFLKEFFSREKKYGSRDRKWIASLCYNFFRLGHMCLGKSLDEQLQTAHFLFTTQPDEWMQAERPEWNGQVKLPLHRKLALAGMDPSKIFPFNQQLSPNLDETAFNISFLIQPDVYIRMRPGKQEEVKRKLGKVDFREVNEHCLAFPNGTRLEEALGINREAVIQDVNSQRVGELFPVGETGRRLKVWDCCAASGGKSILAYDLDPTIDLTVSDIRQSIVQNLARRFTEAGIKAYRAFVADLTDSASLKSSLSGSTFDLIICDAPCSGSGTWSRIPEQLLFFRQEEIDRYARLQKTIVANVSAYLKRGGHLVYITCSVFEKENETVVKQILDDGKMVLVRSEYFAGYNSRADTLYAALFKKEN